jgi:hypothetical protein
MCCRNICLNHPDQAYLQYRLRLDKQQVMQMLLPEPKLKLKHHSVMIPIYLSGGNKRNEKTTAKELNSKMKNWLMIKRRFSP